MSVEPFYVKDCKLAALATGIKAQNLLEFRDKLFSIHPSCIYYHFFGGRLRQSFEHWAHINDFSHWATECLHDDILAERMAVLSPLEHNSLEHLRSEIIEVVENRLDENEVVPWVKPDEQFHFVRAKLVIFKTEHVIHQPSDLVNVIPHLNRSSLFYHFIDSARRVPEQRDDFSTWLQGFGAEFAALTEEIRQIDSYFLSLTDLQKKLTHITSEFFLSNNVKHEHS